MDLPHHGRATILLGTCLSLVTTMEFAKQGQAAAPAPGGQRRPLIVAADGSATHRRISDAMQAARAGDVVLVKPGTYRETVFFKTGVTLRGEDVYGCILKPAENMPAALIAIDCASGSIENLMIDGPNAPVGRSLDLGIEMDVHDGGVWVKGVAKGSPAEQAGIKDGRIASVNGRKVGQSSYLVLAAIVQAGEKGSVDLEIEAGGKVQRKRIRPSVLADEEAWPDGIAMVESSLKISKCIVRGCDTGILSQGESSQPEVRSNRCDSNRHGGIAFWSGSGGLAHRNACEKNGQHGICLTTSGPGARVVSNECRENEDGIYLAGGARGHVESNTCERNKSAGIHVCEARTVTTLVGNRCLDNAAVGIVFHAGTAGSAERNVCERNVSGFEISGSGARVVLKRNQSNSNSRHGIVFTDGASGEAEGNSCWRNRDTGIAVLGSGTVVQVLANDCAKNELHGIAFANGAGGEARGNTCHENRNCGIGVYGRGTRPTLRSNICRANELGISAWDGAAPSIASDNQLQGNKKDLNR